MSQRLEALLSTLTNLRGLVERKDASLRDPYQVNKTLPWSDDSEVSVLVFGDKEKTDKLLFQHDYILRGDQRDVTLRNFLKLWVTYTDHQISDVTLTMHVILPHRLGRQFYAGLDISHGAKTFLEFTTERRGDVFLVKEVVKGAGFTRLRLDEPGMIKQVNFPFPVPNRLEPIEGVYQVEYLRNDGALDTFLFPVRLP